MACSCRSQRSAVFQLVAIALPKFDVSYSTDQASLFFSTPLPSPSLAPSPRISTFIGKQPHVALCLTIARSWRTTISAQKVKRNDTPSLVVGMRRHYDVTRVGSERSLLRTSPLASLRG